MPLTTQGSPLVAGALPGGGPAAVRVEVVRAFLIGGEVQPAGAVIEVSRAFAHEMISAGKARPAAATQEEPLPLAEPTHEPKKVKANARK